MKAPDPQRQSPPEPVRTLVVVCPDWPVVAARRSPSAVAPGVAEPAAPVAVFSANRVVASNAAARRDDVVVGLRRREAQRRCPQLVVVAHDPDRDARAFEAVAAALATLTPRIEITEPGVCSFATRGPSRYHGGDADLARLAAERATAAAGVAVLVGVADGPVVARMAAAHAESGLPRVVPPGKAADFLDALPIASLAGLVPEPDLLVTLVGLGMSTLGAFARLSERDVLGRFGLSGVWLHRLSRGLDPHLLRSGDPPADVAATAEIDPPALRADSVAFTARTLAEDLVEALGGRGLACRDIVVTLQTEHGESHERVWRLDGPLSSDRPRSPVALIAERVRWQVDGWLSGPIGARPTAGVSRVVLAPAAVEPARGRQLGFWGGEAGAGERVLRAVARLEGLVGADAVRVPETAGGREPADAVSLVKAAAVDLGSRRVVKLGTSPANVPGGGVAAPPWPGRLPAPSPSLVHERPQPAEVIDAVGQPIEVSARGELSAAPVQVRIDKTHRRVVGWAGPWLLDERWWDADARRRSARLQVALSDGSAHLMARSQQRWWLIATYA